MSIEISNLSISFGDFKAVRDVNLHINKGQIVGFLGPNGSGKTTTVRMMAGLLSPDTGDVALDGHSIISDRRAAKAVLGVLPEGSALFPHMTLQEHLLMEARARGLSATEADQRSEDLLQYAGLWERRDVYARQASVGMRKKLGISLAIIHLPPIVVLDEPFEGLDPISARNMRSLLQTMVRQRGTTMLLTSHLLALMEGLVDRVAMIHHGEIVRDVSMSALAQSGNSLAQTYLDAFDEGHGGEPDFSWLT